MGDWTSITHSIIIPLSWGIDWKCLDGLVGLQMVLEVYLGVAMAWDSHSSGSFPTKVLQNQCLLPHFFAINKYVIPCRLLLRMMCVDCCVSLWRWVYVPWCWAAVIVAVFVRWMRMRNWFRYKIGCRILPRNRAKFACAPSFSEPDIIHLSSIYGLIR